MLALPREYVGSTVEIKSLTNDLLAIGHIIEIDHEALEIAANDDERMPLLQYRLPAKILVHSSKHGDQVLVGITYLSTENFARLEEVKTLQDFERRGAFRVNTGAQGKLFPLMSDAEQAAFDDKVAASTAEEAEALLAGICTEVRILDISLTGVRLQSPIPLQERARYYIEFALLGKTMGFCLEVQRVIQTPEGPPQYGCRFFDFSDRQIDTLCRELFQLQRIEKNRRRNTLPL